MLSCLQAWGLKTRQQCKRTVFFSVWWRKLQSFTASRKHGTVSKFPFYFRLVHLLSFFEGRSVEKGGHMISIFFFRGHGNQSCNLLGSFNRSVFSYLCPRPTIKLSWVAEYIPKFGAIFHKHISFFQLGSIFKQKRRSLPQTDKLLTY